MIIVSITGPTVKRALGQIEGSSPFADMFEFRMDLISKSGGEHWVRSARKDLALLLQATRKPAIIACRPVWEGGAYSGGEQARWSLIVAACELGGHYVDVELNTNPMLLSTLLRRKKRTGIIVSHHRFDGEPFAIPRLYQTLKRTDADVLKLAVLADDVPDTKVVFDFLSLARADGQRAIALAMGDAGQVSRILYRKFGGWATYAAPEDGGEAAAGQICASQLKQLYRADRLDEKTAVYGVVGNPLRQSKGVFLHNPLFHRAKANAVYCKFPVTDLSAFMRDIAPMLAGFSVTIPHKEKIIRYLGGLDKTATAIGAVNTVIARRRKLVGTNTDAPGALDAIEKVVKVKGRVILIVGAGGAARAIAFEAKKRGADVLIANRSEQRAKKLAREFGLEHVRMAEIRIARLDILVNATPVGMMPHVDESPVPTGMLKDKIVFDAVYNPPMTRLLREAKSAGATVIQGTEMYLHQAMLQSELYTGAKPGIEFMRRLLDSQ